MGLIATVGTFPVFFERCKVLSVLEKGGLPDGVGLHLK
jgi:hypothetical protein